MSESRETPIISPEEKAFRDLMKLTKRELIGKVKYHALDNLVRDFAKVQKGQLVTLLVNHKIYE